MENEVAIVIGRLKRALFAFLIVLIIGTFGYQIVAEGVSWFDGLYMTVLTVTTIGFSEVIALDGNLPGRVFTIIIAFLGIGIITYGFTNLAALFIERDLSKPLKRKRMEREIQKMNQHYIICGGSHVGLHIAGELESTQRAFVIGDINPEVIDSLNGQYRYGKALAGDCTEDKFLQKLNVQKAKGVFVTTRDDNLNLVICVTVRQLRADLRIICHSKDPKNKKKLIAVGANRVISPYSIGGLRMASEMIRPTVTNFLDIMLRDTNKNLRIEEVKVPISFEGKILSDLLLKGYNQSLILALKESGNWIYNPPANHTLKAASTVIVMTSPSGLKQLREQLEANENN